MNEKIKVAKKDNNYMFLTTSKFKFIDIKNFLAPELRKMVQVFRLRAGKAGLSLRVVDKL